MKLNFQTQYIGLQDEVLSTALSWGFEPTEQLESGHCSLVFANASQVLKIPFQGEEMTFGVPAAMKLQSAGGPQVFNHHPRLGMVLMERLRPGTPLSGDDLAVFAKLSNKIQHLDADGAMPLRDYIDSKIPLLDWMDDTTERRVFLHGDLHHANILADGCEWRPIDPKGLVGDPNYECAAILRNPIYRLKEIWDLYEYTKARLLILADGLNLDPWRIAAWGYLDQFDRTGPSTHPWFLLKGVYRRLVDDFGTLPC